MSDAESLPGGNEPRSSALSAGHVIAERYRLEVPIGTGGSATIWRATHLTLGHPVAVKFIDVIGPRQGELRERFLREARVAAAIRHRNVVDIVDFGTEDGPPYMVMELLEGQTLAARIEAGPPFTVGDAVRTMSPILAGLAAVHDAGIVHRDLKPENIFLVDDADVSYPKLIDFGVSRVLDSEAGLQSVLPTRDNAIVGTPQYMAPEQARGLKEIDHRADLWSAGVMLYELLTGTLPFDSDAVGDVIIEVATAEVPPITALRPELAGPLEEVVHRALSRQPDARYASASEMRAALIEAVRATTSEILEQPAPSRAPRGTARTSRSPIDASRLDDELAALDAHLGRDRTRASREETVTLAVSPPEDAAPPERRSLVWVAVAAALLALIAGAAWLGRAPEAPAAEPTPSPPSARLPAPPVTAPVAPPEEPAPPVEAEAEVEPEAPSAPAPRRSTGARRHARMVRDPGF